MRFPGFFKLFRGISPSVLGSFPGQAAYYTSYELFSHKVKELLPLDWRDDSDPVSGFVIHSIAGGMAEIAGGICEFQRGVLIRRRGRFPEGRGGIRQCRSGVIFEPDPADQVGGCGAGLSIPPLQSTYLQTSSRSDCRYRG
ncbi:MAG: hypothetical protein BJ554DRAFT_8462 [Olpidium bornovanus]|uniref:Uncharacterized protein n=1 Tax=Olpidium bornovanus TaxID=278681 RepID=A0A8H8DM32_9FUNG|nr:MAG: hypothetical protein BJ554DRAFT_8462 [Olpidium bornovanus]